MKITRGEKQIHGEMEGSIGDTSLLFTVKLDGIKSLILDMTKVSSINSVGVKHWIMWTLRIPKDCLVTIVNCPYVIANQASIVMGFMSPQIKIESFRAPFVCNDCGAEEIRLLTRGNEYEYSAPPARSKIQIPKNITCVKCNKGALEPDFMVEMTFKFLQ